MRKETDKRAVETQGKRGDITDKSAAVKGMLREYGMLIWRVKDYTF